ncbi:MAG: TonB-dependent receptor [Candidatus Binataceae bacterium]
MSSSHSRRPAMPDVSRSRRSPVVIGINGFVPDIVKAVSGRGALVRAALTLALMMTLLAGAVSAGQKQAVSGNVTGTVKDALGRPLVGVSVSIQAADGRTIARSLTSDQGRFRFAGIRAGTYALVTRKKGFKPATMVIATPQQAGKSFDLVLASEEALTMRVSANRTRVQNTLTETGASKYTLTNQDIKNLPEGEATPLNQVVLQMPGVALDQNQEIHIRGEHLGIQYQVNGVLLPLDLNTDPTFNQLLNSQFIKSVSLADGILPARYGYRTAGVIDIRTKDGCGDGQSNFQIYGGQRDTARPSVELQGCHGAFSYYVTGLYLHSNLGFSSATPAPDPIHDHIDEGQGFAYLAYQLSPFAKLSLMSGATYVDAQFPNVSGLRAQWQLDGIDPAFYPSTRINSRLDQQDYFGVLALDGVIGENADYQIAYSTHYNNENFHPDPVGELLYQGVASHVFNSDLSNSLEGDFTYRLGGGHTLGAGFYLGEYGVEIDDHSLVFPVDANRAQKSTTPISVGANLNKINLVYGVYLQDTWQITEKLSVNFGSRWDRLQGFSENSQFSPTINLVYKFRPDTTLHAGFARYFQIPNFQGISPSISNIFAGTSGSLGVASGGNVAPEPETDYYWDAGLTHEILPRLMWEEDNYFRIDRHYLDEGQFGAVPIDAPLNYKRGYGGGVENTLTYNLPKLSLRASVFVAREEDIGVATGQYNFSPAELAYINRHYFVLDHTPLVGASGGAAYRWGDYHFTIDGLFSSGLRGGFANETQLPKVWQFNLSAAREFHIPRLGKVENRIILLNIFDRTNLIRPATGIGVFQAAYGPRITVYDALTIPLPSL